MRRFYIFPTVALLFWVLKHNIQKDKGTDKQSVSSYLSREDAANAVRKQDISNLPYIKIPFDKLPLDITLNDKKKQLQIEQHQKDFRNLSNQPMLNLIGISNTQLKESYGVANLEYLAACDERYTRYIRTLYLYANTIYEEYPAEAIQILQYSTEIGTDILGVYELLADYHISHARKDEFMKLYDLIPEKDSISGRRIIQKLDERKAGL